MPAANKADEQGKERVAQGARRQPDGVLAMPRSGFGSTACAGHSCGVGPQQARYGLSAHGCASPLLLRDDSVVITNGNAIIVAGYWQYLYDQSFN